MGIHRLVFDVRAGSLETAVPSKAGFEHERLELLPAEVAEMRGVTVGDAGSESVRRVDLVTAQVAAPRAVTVC